MVGFSIQILKWYTLNKRDLPWRTTKNPYKIWISEIMLQQTRVFTVLDYYNRFLIRFPTIYDLANAPEDDILNLWQGLGYYSRARNLQAAAKMVVDDYEGKFPSTYDEIIKLKGIGEYTAAAIGSFSFDLPFPVIDGNVFRVIARYKGIDVAIDTTEGKKVFKELANELFDSKRPADYNQAIMEFGALQCTPKQPDCENCVLNEQCVAFSVGKVSELPKKSKKIKKRDRHFTYLVLKLDDKWYMKKRGGKDIWEGLFDFPLIESNQFFDQNEIEERINELALNSSILKIVEMKKQVLSHQVIYSQFVLVELVEEVRDKEWFLVDSNSLQKIGVPILVDNFLQMEMLN